MKIEQARIEIEQAITRCDAEIAAGGDEVMPVEKWQKKRARAAATLTALEQVAARVAAARGPIPFASVVLSEAEKNVISAYDLDEACPASVRGW